MKMEKETLSRSDKWKINKSETSYIVFSTPHGDCMKCLECGSETFHPDDIKNKYCGCCHRFLEK